MLQAENTGEKLSDNLLTDKGELARFIDNKHGRESDPIQAFLDSFQPNLAESHPLKSYKIKTRAQVKEQVKQAHMSPFTSTDKLDDKYCPELFPTASDESPTPGIKAGDVVKLPVYTRIL